MKNHLKSIPAPKTWIIDRKTKIFTIRPKSGAHSLSNGLALGIIIRDELKLASTLTETKKVLTNNEILVDGKRRKDYRFIVGLFDVLKVTANKQSYRLILDKKGRIIIVPISETESHLKVCKVVGKSILSGNKMQINLHDGKNINTDVKVNVGDSVVLTVPENKVKEVLPLTQGASVFLTQGKHNGDLGKFKEIKGREAIYIKDGEEIMTAKEYLFVVGKDKPVIEIKN
ncbi:MAG: 30S ribosomal protein S4e [Candidatus Woesearchaeota archaeon]|jgi:small subunit ribosomal protein S4e